MKESLIQQKSFAFSLVIIKLYKELITRNEYVISKQLLRSGTSIGANVEEGTAAQSKRDFLSKLSIASKEARETKYWLRLLAESDLVSIEVDAELLQVEELIRILTAIVKTTSESLTKNSTFKTQNSLDG